MTSTIDKMIWAYDEAIHEEAVGKAMQEGLKPAEPVSLQKACKAYILAAAEETEAK